MVERLQHATEERTVEEESHATDEQLWHAAEERAHKKCEIMDKRVHEDLELKASNDRMKLDQEKKQVHANARMKKEYDAYNKDRTISDFLNDRRFKVPQSILQQFRNKFMCFPCKMTTKRQTSTCTRNGFVRFSMKRWKNSNTYVLCMKTAWNFRTRLSRANLRSPGQKLA